MLCFEFICQEFLVFGIINGFTTIGELLQILKNFILNIWFSYNQIWILTEKNILAFPLYTLQSPAKFNCFKMLDVLLIFFKKRTITIKNTLVLMMNQIHQIKYDVSSTLYWTNMYIGSWLTLVSSWDCFCHEDSKHKTLKTPIGHKY